MYETNTYVKSGVERTRECGRGSFFCGRGLIFWSGRSQKLKPHPPNFLNS